MLAAGRSGIRLRRWTLWSFSSACVAWMLLGELAAAAAVAFGVAREPGPTYHAWLMFAAIGAATVAHLVFTGPAEQRQRAARLRAGKVEHVDQTSIWLFSAALLLPVLFVLGLVALVRAKRYLIAHRPPSRWLFTSASILLSALAVHWVGAVTGLTAWLRAGHVGALSATALRAVGGLAAAIAVYFLVQAVLVGVYRGLRTGSWSPGSTLGSRQDNLFIVYTLLLASLAALVAGFAPPLLAIMAVVAIRGTRDEERKARLASERAQAELDASHDAKTGLLNARGFGLYSTAALTQDSLLGRTSSFLMCDLDHFKQWNTRLGHVGADRLLRAVADTVRANVRPTDLVCRWGGEEIAVLLPNTDVINAADVAERLRAAVEGLSLSVSRSTADGTITIPGPDNGIPHCTISIGVAAVPHAEPLNPTLPAVELLDRMTRLADDAMYVAKATGRNRVCRADGVPIAESGEPWPFESPEPATT